MRDRMTRVMRIAGAALLPGVVAVLVAAPAHAQTAAAAPAAPAAAAAPADDCLTTPNPKSPAGSHWYYRIERPSGRHCWYVRADGGKAAESESAKPRAAAPPVRPRAHVDAPAAPASASRAVTPSTTSAAPRVAPSALSAAPSAPSAGPSAGPSAAPTAAPSAAPSAAPGPAPSAPSPALAWPNAPAQQPLEPAPAADRAAEQPVPPLLPSFDATAANPETSINSDAPSPAAAPPPPAPVRPADTGEVAAHMPALLGVGIALVLIVLGSFAIGLLAQRLRRPSGRGLGDLPLVDLPETSADEAPFWTEERLSRLRVDSRPETPRDPEPLRVGGGERADAFGKPRHQRERVAGVNAENTSLFDDRVRALLLRLSAEMRPHLRGIVDVASADQPSRFVAPPLQPLAAEPEDQGAAMYARRRSKR